MGIYRNIPPLGSGNFKKKFKKKLMVVPDPNYQILTKISNFFDDQFASLRTGIKKAFLSFLSFKSLVIGMLSNLDDIALGNSSPTSLIDSNSRLFDACKGILKFKF